MMVTRPLRIRLIAATLCIAVAPLVFLGLSRIIAEQRVATAQRRAAAALTETAAVLGTALSAPGVLDPHTVAQQRAEAEAQKHQLRIELLDGSRQLIRTRDYGLVPARPLDRISFGSLGPPTLQRLDSARPPLWQRPEVQRAHPGAGPLVHCLEPLTAGSAPTISVCGAVLVLPAGGPAAGWVLFAEQIVRRPLLAETHIQLRVLTGYVLIVAMWPLVVFFGWGVMRPLDKLRAQVQQHAAHPLSLPQVHVEGQDEIAELAEAFNGLLRALAERVHQNEEFIANVAHEMKNPVAAIRAAAEALGRTETLDEARARRLSRVLLESSQKLDALVTRFLDLARAEAGLPNEERVAIFLPDLVGRLTEQLRADERYHTVRFEIDAHPLSVSGVAGRIESVFTNLLDNAASFAPARLGASEPPWVRVRIRRDPERPQAIIEISDSGPGIAPEDLKHLFKRFFTKRPRGSGLGLVLSRSLVEAHGGSLQVSSPPGQGATFTVRLPLLEAAAVAAAGRSGGFKPLQI